MTGVQTCALPICFPVTIPVQLKRTLEAWYRTSILKLDYKSCEMIARELHSQLISQWSGRDYVIEVSEDGENGCRIYFPKDIHVKRD